MCKMSHINSVDYAGWHLPCYAIHNCPQRLLSKGNAGYAAESDDVLAHQSAGAGQITGIISPSDENGGGVSGDQHVVSAFLWALVLVSLIELVVAFALVGSLRPFRRPGRNVHQCRSTHFWDIYSFTLISTVWGVRLFKRFCKMFSLSSPCWPYIT